MGDLLPMGLEKQPEHIHLDEVMSEYTSTGENLLGEIVTCKMAKVVCLGCESESVRFISAV